MGCPPVTVVMMLVQEYEIGIKEIYVGRAT